jgi:predicted O-methyltransferase YrrM
MCGLAKTCSTYIMAAKNMWPETMPDWAEVLRELNGALSVTECEVLSELASGAHGRALEVGHYTGLSSVVLLTSLPDEVELVTVDHHLGDQWSNATSPDRYRRNMQPYVGKRHFKQIDADFKVVLPELYPDFGFVFYDADHTAQAVCDFWRDAASLCLPKCTLVFDDADWSGQSALTVLAEGSGFRSVRTRDFHRGADDKRSPDTYTLEVMVRP